jgi:hypothetical protein
VKTKFACPRCRAVLNPGDRIILAVRLGKAQGLILLSPQPADYRYVCDDSFSKYLQVGDLVDFSCPICSEDLTSPLSEKLVEILVLAPDAEIQVAQFSRICGEHATFVHNGREMQAYGEDRSRFDDLDFGEYDRWW